MFNTNRNINKNINMEYYNILGIQKTSSQKDIKKAYHKLAKKYHPDKIPANTSNELKAQSNAKFQQIGEAYEILSDPEKRKIYDIYGKDGLKQDQQAGMNPFDVFNNIFNMGSTKTNNTFSRKREVKSEPVVYNMGVQLRDLFNGKVVKLKITRKVIINLDNNQPVPINNLETTWDTCSNCHGNGLIMTTKQIAPGFISQQQTSCSNCYGTGKKLKSGYDLRDHPEIIEIKLDKGFNIQNSHIIQGKGNCYPGTVPGDIIIGFILNPDKTFTIRGCHLVMKHTISLMEALCGFKVIINHPDENIGTTQINNRKIVKPNSSIEISGLGLINPNNNNKGSLIIELDIDFPDQLSDQDREILKNVLTNTNGNNSNGHNTNGHKHENDEIVCDTIFNI
jgi:DnaJ homolog subfamily A member 2